LGLIGRGIVVGGRVGWEGVVGVGKGVDIADIGEGVDVAVAGLRVDGGRLHHITLVVYVAD
jgi:hypothetical protein